MQMKRCVILCAAPRKDAGFFSRFIRESDYLICVDGGMTYAQQIDRTPDLLVGDFDSMPYQTFSGFEVIRHPPEKDDTDAMLAVKEGLRRGYRDFLFLAATGGRLDHTIANLMLLDYLNAHNAQGTIQDENNTLLFLRNASLSLPGEAGGKFSVFAWGGDAENISIKNAAYPVERFVMHPGYPSGVSNEFLNGPAEISVDSGALLICISKD